MVTFLATTFSDKGSKIRAMGTAIISARRTRVPMIIAAALSVVLVVDPFGMGSLVSAVLADPPGDGDLSRSERVDAVIDGLDIAAPVAATPITGSWDALPANGGLSDVPADPPTEDEQVVVLGDGGEADPIAYSTLLSTDEESDPGVVDLGGMTVAVAATDPETTPDAVLLRVAGETETAAAGITGVLLEVTDASEEAVENAEVELTVSYESFAGLVGGDWASRLRVVWMPDCGTEVVDCAPVPLESVNDPLAQTVTAVVPVGEGEGTISALKKPGALARTGEGSGGSLAVTAGASGANGNWGATSLSPASTWGAGGSTGGFSWSLPFTTPTVPAGPSPQLGLSYSSAASDGRTPSSNNQSGLVGEGFDLSTGGYIERSYVPCIEDDEGSANNVGRPSADLCWGTENATLMFQGSGVELIKDDATGTWHSKNDDGSRVERLTGAWNGGQQNEYWKVTTTDGTQYFFGRGQRSEADTTALNSAWTVPVYGNHSGEPCYDTDFVDSRCNQVWRWNLEYVVDPSGNSLTYFYTKETNSYVYDIMGNYSGTTASYTSGGRVDRIEYGTRAGSETTASAPAKVTFTTSPRCITDLADPDSFCSSAQTSTSSNKWLDTPVDLVCSSEPCTNFTPVFFDRSRLSAISTFAYDGVAYQPIDSWSIQQQFVASGSSGLEYAASPMLITTGVTHTALNGTSSTTADDLTLPEIQFGYMFLDNRVDSTADGVDPLRRPRVTDIRTETGASITVNYRTECTASDKPGTTESEQEANNRLCYPVKWAESDYAPAEVEYFHKYVVESMVESAAPPAAGGNALITGSLSKLTTFAYGGGAFWARPTGALVTPSEMTFSEFRGFAEVTVTEGESGESSSIRNQYFRGTGEELTAGPTGSEITVTDEERYIGQVFVATELNGTTPVFETITEPGEPVVTAENAQHVKASRIPSSTSHGFGFDAGGNVEFHTRSSTTSDAYGQGTLIEDSGDVAVTTDDVCTRVTYAYSSQSAFVTSHQVALAAATETVSKACDAEVVRPDDVISNVTTSYDSAGRPTQSDHLDPSDGIGQVLDRTVLDYDAWGRPLEVSDASGQITQISYTHSAGGLLQSSTTATADPDGSGPLAAFSTTTTFNALTGRVLSTTDPNGRVTSGTYDALGRLLTVRYPQHQSSSTPSVEYSYAIGSNGLNSVVTKKLGADGVTQHVSVVLYDGLLRPFQSQFEGADAGADHNADAAARGRMVAQIYYDSAGRVVKQTGQWWATGVPTGSPVEAIAVPPSQTTIEYDGAGRPVAQVLWVGTDSNPANEKWRTVTAYDGATTVQLPPMGGTPQAVVTDALGRTVELRQYLRDPDVGAAADTVAEVLALGSQSTTYAYDAAGQRTEMRDAGDNVWTYDYNWAGQIISATDPDAGTATTTYDAMGRVATHTDGNGDTLAYVYDAFGRVTSLHDGTSSGPVRASWEYDQATDSNSNPVLGLMSSATRFVDGAAYTTSIPRYDFANRPLTVTVELPDIPEFDALDSLSYSTHYSYAADGQVASISYPAVLSDDVSRLGAETVTTRFDTASMPSWMGGGFGWGTYVAEGRFGSDGRLLLTDLGNTYGAITSYDYEEGTNRLQGIALNREGFNGTDVDIQYGYDAAGNVTSMSDRPTQLTGTATQDNQCFGYDGLRRLQVAWTSADANCAVAQGDIENANVGGVAPYWSEYEYDALGNRTQLVEHGPDEESTRTTDYEYGTSGASPHQLTQLTKTVGTTVSQTAFTYDDAGNRLTSGDAEYVWDAEGELSSVDDDENVYDASGKRLVRSAASGTTVYLPGGQEIHISGSTVSGSRYYSFGGSTVATRTGAGLGAVTSLVSDHHGSVLAAVPNTVWTASSVTRVFSDPFGAVRGGSDASVPGDHRFLGAVMDAAAGLSLLGARYYDATIGRFISVDPELNPANPAQFNAYDYSGNNPLTWSDPSGRDFWSFLGDVAKNVKKAANAVGDFIYTYKAEIIGTVVGIAVTGLCLAATAGAGSIGCVIAGAAAGGAVSGAMSAAVTAAQSGQLFTPQGMLSVSIGFTVGGLVGAATGAVGGVLGMALGKVVSSAASTSLGGAIKSFVSTITSKFKPGPLWPPTTAQNPTTFRGDSRPHSDVFDEGFKPLGANADLERHALGLSDDSAYVSTSTSVQQAERFAENVYTIRAPGGIDVNDVLGARSPFPDELEIAFEGGIPSSCIVGCTMPGGVWVPNPGFVG